MTPTRRAFLKLGTGAAAASALGFDLTPAYAQARELKIARTTETRSTCPYCSVSCGVIIHTLGDKSKNVRPAVVHVEGDPDHPIKSGQPVPQGRNTQAGHRQRPPSHARAVSRARQRPLGRDRKSTRLNSSHLVISYA